MGIAKNCLCFSVMCSCLVWTAHAMNKNSKAITEISLDGGASSSSEVTVSLSLPGELVKKLFEEAVLQDNVKRMYQLKDFASKEEVVKTWRSGEMKLLKKQLVELESCSNLDFMQDALERKRIIKKCLAPIDDVLNLVSYFLVSIEKDTKDVSLLCFDQEPSSIATAVDLCKLALDIHEKLSDEDWFKLSLFMCERISLSPKKLFDGLLMRKLRLKACMLKNLKI